MQNYQAINRNKGFILLPVVLTLAILASIAYLLSRESAINVGNINREQQQDTALYIAQAGYNHALWQLNQQNCTGYNIPTTSFAHASYSTTITDTTGSILTAGSPVNIQIVSALADGASYSINRFREKIYQYPYTTVTLQLGTDPGKDAMIPNSMMLKNSNFGHYEQKVSSPSGFRPRRNQLIQFELSSIPTYAGIISAKLKLKQNDSDSLSTDAEVKIHRLKQAWVEGSESAGWPPDGTTWNTSDGSQRWKDDSGNNISGGAYDATSIANTAITSDNILRAWNITSLVQDWHEGKYTNEGMLLKSAGDLSVEFASKEDSTIADRPKLTITYRCECGKICCNADYIANNKLQEFNLDPGSSDIWDISFLPADTTIFGATIPSNGGWVMIDSSDSRFYITDSSGSALTDQPLFGGTAKGVTFISAGTWEGHLAISYPSTQLIDITNMNGTSQTSFSTDSFTENPLGLSFITMTKDGINDNNIAIASDKNSSGSSEGSIFIVDDLGTLKSTIDVNAFIPEPYAVSHLPGTNKLLVASKDDELFVIDFDGNLYHQYYSDGFGLSQLQGVAINPSNCQHVIVSKDSQTVGVLESL